MNLNEILNSCDEYDINLEGLVYTPESHVLYQTYTSKNNDVFVLLKLKNSVICYPILKAILVYDFFYGIPRNIEIHRIKIDFIDNDKNNFNPNNLAFSINEEHWLKATHPKYEFTESYEISSYGNIRVIDNDKITILGKFISYGYIFVSLKTSEGIKRIPLHQLVCSTFHGLPSDGRTVVNHINAIKSDNYPINLEWVTKRENEIHAGMLRLVRNGTKKISAEMCRLIEDMLIEHEGRATEVYNILHDEKNLDLSLSNVKAIKNHMEYPFFKNLHKKMTDDREKLIKKFLIKNNGSPMKTLKELQSIGITNESEESVTRVKNRMNYYFERLNKAKMNDDEITYIRAKLIEYNGDTKKTHEAVQKIFIRITRSDIDTVKAKMKTEGVDICYKRTAVKISHELREQLLKLLKANDYSPSKAFKHVQNMGISNVTIHDLKYLKRKYLK